MKERIQQYLGLEYDWIDGELHYRGNPLTWLTDWEQKQVRRAQEETPVA